jgi:acyl dehydratase
MSLNHDAAGVTSAVEERSWTRTDSLIYALGVGAGRNERAFTTENTAGIEQQALPTMPVVLTTPARDLFAQLGPLDWTKIVHGTQEVVLDRPLPPEGTICQHATVDGVYDKGSGALVQISFHAVDATDGQPLFRSSAGMFVRGAGGWGGDRGPAAGGGPVPERSPDHVIELVTTGDQALLYRLSGDRNRLHSDPAFAAKAGFEAPILHGLCTYGFTGRALLASVCDGDPARFTSMRGRFSAPVVPGDTLTVSVWELEPGLAAFRTTVGERTVLDDGRVTFT